jgi:hypothetical protein
MCPECQGLGVTRTMDPKLLVEHPEKSLLEGAIPLFPSLRNPQARHWYEGVAKHATHVVDLHSWSRFSATGGIIKDERPDIRALADVSAIRFVHVSKPGGKAVNTITAYKNRLGAACYTIELTTQYTVVEHEVRRGTRAVLNIAKHLGMIEGELEGKDEPVIFLDKAKETAIKAERAGLFVEAGLATWDYVEKGQKLGHILNDETLEVEEIFAPVSGYLKEYGVRRPDCDVALPAQHPPQHGAGDAQMEQVETAQQIPRRADVARDDAQLMPEIPRAGERRPRGVGEAGRIFPRRDPARLGMVQLARERGIPILILRPHHGVGGLVGTLMVAFFASTTLGGKTDAETYSMGAQFLVQLKASAIVIVYTLIVSVIILYLVQVICGGSLRASESEEEEGLDLTAHGESGYNN